VDHTKPAQFRVDDYLDRDDLDASLDDLRSHKLKFSKETGKGDGMARDMSRDDYGVKHASALACAARTLGAHTRAGACRQDSLGTQRTH
jgi:hypothetical protein